MTPPTHRVFFDTPHDGDIVSGYSVHVVMDSEGLVIEPAIKGVSPGHGHFHVLVDTPCAVPGEKFHGEVFDFALGERSGDIPVYPGAHQMCLQAGDGNHVALPYTDVIHILSKF
jgi:hypothetical protein